MSLFLYVILTITVVVIIFLTIHFFVIDIDNKKTMDSYELELVHYNRMLYKLEQRILHLEKDRNRDGKRDIRKNKSNNRITK